MKKTSLIIFTFFLLLNVSANDITYNRLTKLYEKDAKQCLVAAKRYMKLFPENASPYYFAAIIYKDKVVKARNTKGKYFHMTKSLSFAKKFDDRDDADIKGKVEWDIAVIELEVVAQSVIDELTDSEFSELGERLAKKIAKYEFMNVVFIANDGESLDVKVSETVAESGHIENSSGFVKIPGQFYGMPKGTEIIKSHNPASELKMLRLINAERKKQGMTELTWEEDLAKACRYHAYDLGTQNYFDHDSYDRINGNLVEVGGTFKRIRTFYNETFVNSENIAAGNESAAATYQQWYTSKGHYDNMFNKNSRKVGIGVYRVPGSQYEYYWVFCTALD